MSTSGGVAGDYRGPAAGETITFGQNYGGTVSPVTGTLRLAPVRIPVPLTITQLGCETSVAGDVGGTFTPLFYRDNGHGRPAGLFHIGPALPVNPAAVAFAADPFTLPAGWWWVGGLVLASPVTPPTLRAQSMVADGPLGGPKVANPGAIYAWCVQASGLAAPPDPVVPTFAANIVPLVAAIL